MNIYIFVSESQPNLRAFTSDVSGDNLPTDYAPWRAANGGNAMPLKSDTDPLAKAVKRDGYFLVTAREYARRG
jgi:hypothetical protein